MVQFPSHWVFGMNEIITTRYSVSRDSHEVKENRVKRTTLRDKAAKHNQSQRCPIVTIVSLVPRLFFGLKRGLGFVRKAEPVDVVPEPPVQTLRYFVQGQEISAPTTTARSVGWLN